MTEKEILVEAYTNAKELDFASVPNEVKNDINMLIAKIGSNKSLVSALATSLVKKIHTPAQDVRLHRTDFPNGYSARVLDTQIISPFFKDYFPKYANKESAFLTMVTRSAIKWTKEEGENLPIRDKQLRDSFLNIFEQIEVYQKEPYIYLKYLFAKLIELSVKEEEIFQFARLQANNSSYLNINLIINILKEFFEVKLASRLPVIAMYSIYEMLMPTIERYKNKKLLDLQVHTSSDKHGFGDIEIYDENDKPYEILEIKHNIPIDKYLIFDITKKISNIKIDRYYILTTFENSFMNIEAEKEVMVYIAEIKKLTNTDIIANGIIGTLKYYLRFLDNYPDFILIFTQNLIKDAKNSTEVKNFHLEKWAEILKKYQIEC